jgi:flagellar protein FlgJ
MDIQQLGSQYLNSTAYTSAALGMSGGLQAAGGAFGGDSFSSGNFADALEKAKMDQILNSVSRMQEQPEIPRDVTQLSGDRGEIDALPVSGKPLIDKTSKLYEQCEALETFLVKTLITGMRNTVQKTGLVDEGFAGQMYEDMLYDEYSKSFTQNTDFGLSELAYLELTGQRGRVRP